VLRRKFGTKRDEVIGGWRKPHLYSLLSIIRMFKLRKMRWARHVVRLLRRGMHIGFWWECQKERDYQQDIDVGGKIILKLILEGYDGVIWTGLFWLRI
jgi:hypothetical protein